MIPRNPAVPSVWAFGPDSPLTLVLAVLLAVAALVAAVVVVRRRRALAARVVAVLLTQLLVVCVGLLVVNQAERIMTTWAALFGRTAGLDPTVAVERTGADLAASDPGEDLWAVTSTQRAEDRKRGYDGTAEQVILRGATTGYALPAVVYLPGSYRSDPERRFPVVEMLAGYPGSYQSWPDGLRLTQTLDALIAEGRMPAAIVISPSQNPHPPADSECVDATAKRPESSKAETYLVDDVPSFLKAHYRVGEGRLNWVVGGYSTGGFCAANIALRHPMQYAAALSLSGNYTAIEDETTGTLYADEASRRANSPLWTVREKGRPPLVFAVAAAQDAPDDYSELKSFSAAVPGGDDLEVVLSRTGGHSPAVWRVTSRMMLPWIASVLAKAG